MILLVGGDSEIGSAALRHLRAQGRQVAATTRRRNCVAVDRPFLDFTQVLDSWEPPQGTRAACIFAAIARLADCASDPEGSAYINVTQTLTLIERLIERGIAVLFLSTNQVFDGHAANVSAEAPMSPVSTYGRQKASAEAVLHTRMDEGRPVAILRLAKVVSPDMALIHGWIRALKAGQPIRAFDDMPMAPAPTELVAAVISSLLQDEARGIYQLTGPRDVTYAELGHYVAKRLGVDRGLVTAISAREAGLPEGATPRHTTLDSSLLRTRYGLVVPDVWPVMDSVIAAGRGQGQNANPPA